MRKPLSVLIPVLLVAALAVALSFRSSGPDDVATAATEPAPATTTTDPGPTPEEVKAYHDAYELLLADRWIRTTEASERWYAEAARRAEAERVAAEQAAARALERERAEAAQAAQDLRRSTPAPVAEQGSGRCGGDLPPCWVMMRESGGDIRAKNPTSTASGKWQFLNSTWAGFGGYSEAWMAPESVQDARARQLWAGGAGCSHWSAC